VPQCRPRLILVESASELVELGRECDECSGAGGDCWLCRGKGYVVLGVVPLTAFQKALATQGAIP
jgi:hypothetical protein